MGEQVKTIGFATAVCLVCSLLLSVVYSSLKDEQERNKANDLKVKVLTVFDIKVRDEKGRMIMAQEDIDKIFNEQIAGKVLDKDGKEAVDVKIADLSPEDVNERDKVTGLKHYYPLYVYKNPASGEEKIAIHLSGMGLWSVVKAYMAMKSDLATVAGIVFYDHAETPGLGGEIEKDFFQNRFKDKKMYGAGVEQRFRILKLGQETDDFSISGISGATMTCKGVERFINDDFAVYNKYFEENRK